MNWEALGAAGEIVGALAVIVTLLFLAGQLRQNNRLAKAEAEREWFATWYGLIRDAMGSDEAINLFREGLNNYSSLSNNEKGIFSTRLIAMFDHVDVLRRLNENGYVSDDILAPVLRVLNSVVACPGGRDWWQEIGPILTIHQYFESHQDLGASPLTALLPYLVEATPNKSVESDT